MPKRLMNFRSFRQFALQLSSVLITNPSRFTFRFQRGTLLPEGHIDSELFASFVSLTPFVPGTYDRPRQNEIGRFAAFELRLQSR